MRQSQNKTRAHEDEKEICRGGVQAGRVGSRERAVDHVQVWNGERANLTNKTLIGQRQG